MPLRSLKRASIPFLASALLTFGGIVKSDTTPTPYAQSQNSQALSTSKPLGIDVESYTFYQGTKPGNYLYGGGIDETPGNSGAIYFVERIVGASKAQIRSIETLNGGKGPYNVETFSPSGGPLSSVPRPFLTIKNGIIWNTHPSKKQKISRSDATWLSLYQGIAPDLTFKQLRIKKNSTYTNPEKVTVSVYSSKGGKLLAEGTNFYGTKSSHCGILTVRLGRGEAMCDNFVVDLSQLFLSKKGQNTIVSNADFTFFCRTSNKPRHWHI